MAYDHKNIPVSAEDWLIDEALLTDAARKDHLIDVPAPTELIGLVSEAAASGARGDGIHLFLVQAVDEPDYVRIEAKIALPNLLFDRLFNGRSGYRAHYYASSAKGAAFNRSIVDSLIPAVLEACRCSMLEPKADVIKRSLSGRYSKIWVVGDGEAFLASPAALKPERWAAYWHEKEKAFGLRLPCPAAPQLDLKGTFVELETGNEWVAEEKRDRDEEIFKKGWA
jgi:hypothetical protein